MMTRNFLKENRALCGVILGAVILHSCVFITLLKLSEKFPNAMNSRNFPAVGGGFDSDQYVTLSQNIFKYGAFSMESGPNGSPETFRTPGYPFFVGLVTLVTGSMIFVPIFQIFILGLCIFIIYKIAVSISLSLKPVGLIAGGLFAVDPAVLYVTHSIGGELLYAFFLLLCVYYIVQKTYSNKITYGLAGLSYGLSALIRPSGLLMIVPIGVWILWETFLSKEKRKNWKDGVRLVGVFFLVAFLTITPWVIRNKIRTGALGFSSVDAYNAINFNIPMYLNYKERRPVEEIRMEIFERISNISDEEQMDLKNSAMMRKTAIDIMKPHFFGYTLFHISKSANFFLSSSLKGYIGYLKGFWQGSSNKAWQPEMSLINSVLARDFGNVSRWLCANSKYLPESSALLILLIASLYYVISERSKEAAFLIFLAGSVAMITGPLSNPEYRVPVIPFIDLSGVAGVFLIRGKLKQS